MKKTITFIAFAMMSMTALAQSENMNVVVDVKKQHGPVQDRAQSYEGGLAQRYPFFGSTAKNEKLKNGESVTVGSYVTVSHAEGRNQYHVDVEDKYIDNNGKYKEEKFKKKVKLEPNKTEQVLVSDNVTVNVTVKMP